MQDSSFHCLCEVCLFLRKDGNSYIIALLQKEVCVGVDLLGPDISSQGSPPPLSTPGSTNKVRWNAWLLRLCHIFLLDGWILIPDICRDPTRIHCLERSNESQPGPASLRASRKRIDLPEPEGLICTETGEFAKIIITDASQCWYLHKHNSAILPCKKSTVTTHPQQCREENQGPCHCGSSLVSLGKYCKNNVTSRDYEHLNNAMGLFAPMAACCTSSVDMAISQTWQPKVPSLLWDVIAGVPSNPTVLLISLLPADAQLCIWNPAPALECFLPNISSTLCFPIRRALLRLVAHCLPCKESASWEAQPFPTKPTI